MCSSLCFQSQNTNIKGQFLLQCSYDILGFPPSMSFTLEDDVFHSSTCLLDTFYDILSLSGRDNCVDRTLQNLQTMASMMQSEYDPENQHDGGFD